MSADAWGRWKAEQANIGWRAWFIGNGFALLCIVAGLGLLDLAGYAKWGLLPAALAPLVGLTLVRIVSRLKAL